MKEASECFPTQYFTACTISSANISTDLVPLGGLELQSVLVTEQCLG